MKPAASSSIPTCDAAELIQPRFWQESSSFVAQSGTDAAPPASALPEHTIAFATSGSTGEPSWIVISKDALLASAAAVNRHLHVTTESRWGLALPLHHVGGFGVVARTHEAGCDFACFAARWNAAKFTEWAGEERITHTSLVPTQVHDLVHRGLKAPASLRAVVVGGGELAMQEGQNARALGWPVLASYGMTEAASQIATQGPDALESPFTSSPLPLLDIWQVRSDPESCLEISGPALFQGWMTHNGGHWTYQPRTESWFTTRDLVELLPDRRLRIVGRADDLVKILGELVSPIHLETVLREQGGLPTSFPFAIAVLPDARSGHRLIPVIEESADQGLLETAVARHNASCAGHLRLPAAIVIQSIPRSPLGKIRRSSLRSILTSTHAAVP